MPTDISTWSSRKQPQTIRKAYFPAGWIPISRTPGKPPPDQRFSMQDLALAEFIDRAAQEWLEEYAKHPAYGYQCSQGLGGFMENGHDYPRRKGDE